MHCARREASQTRNKLRLVWPDGARERANDWKSFCESDWFSMRELYACDWSVSVCVSSLDLSSAFSAHFMSVRHTEARNKSYFVSKNNNNQVRTIFVFGRGDSLGTKKKKNGEWRRATKGNLKVEIDLNIIITKQNWQMAARKFKLVYTFRRHQCGLCVCECARNLDSELATNRQQHKNKITNAWLIGRHRNVSNCVYGRMTQHSEPVSK